MIKVAITGNIASGKTQVEKILENKGFIVFDTDKIAHEILGNSEAIKKAFKDFDILEDNKISRKKLGNIVFSNNDLRKRLESIIHPKIKQKIKDIFEQNKKEQFVFISIPLLFEADMTDLFDKIIFIYADDNIRLERLMKRNNLTEQDALARLNSQQSQQEKVKYCDFVIKNNSSISDLEKQVLSALNSLNF